MEKSSTASGESYQEKTFGDIIWTGSIPFTRPEMKRWEFR